MTIMQIRSKSYPTFGLCLVVMSVLLFSCETDVGSPDLPYVKRIVIQGVLNPDSSTQKLNITRTITAYEKRTPESAVVTNAVVKLLGRDSIHSYQFDPVANAYRLSGFKPTIGERYTIVVEWDGLTANAETFIPERPVIDSIAVTDRKSVV